MRNPIRLAELNLLYRDEYLVAVDKPPGMIVHRVLNSVRNDEPVLLQTLRDQLDCLVYPVHRLDQPTSGVILFGLSPTVAAAMVDLFTRRHVAKYYQAFVRGWMHREGRIQVPLVTPQDEPIPKPKTLHIATQAARTDFSTIRWYELPNCIAEGTSSRFSLVEAQPRTGRWHQIRRHLKHIAHPIIGDYRHGDERYNRWFETFLGTHRLMLAACYIEFRHPFTGNLISIRAPRGENFDELLRRISDFEIPIELERLPHQPQSQQVDGDKSDDCYLST